MKAQNTAPGSAPEPREAVVYAELLSKAHEEGLKSIQTQLLLTPSEENGRLAVVKATVEVERGHFEGLGDADPGSVEAFLAPHLIRVAETRAKARALRDAGNVGVVSFEELDGISLDRDSSPGLGATSPLRSSRHTNPSPAPARPRVNGQPKGAPRNGNGSDSMTDAQRRYLFRHMAGQGYQREAAEERLKDLFQVGALSEVTKAAATAMIDRLLNPAPQGAGHGATPDF